MSKLGEKERKELRRRAFELHLQDDQLIAVGHVAIRSAMLDKLIDLTFQQIIRHYPETLRNELDKLSSPKRIKVIQDDLTQGYAGQQARHSRLYYRNIFGQR
jgi:hypothetical protein